MNNLKKNIANNITQFRKNAQMTQAELAERINYSDKAVSKWERGESVPDVIVLKELADIFRVKVDDFFGDAAENTEYVGESEITVKRHNYRNIVYLSVSALWFIVFVVFVAFWIASEHTVYLWQVFVGAVPVMAVLLIVLNSIWGKVKNNLYLISLFIWTTLLAAYLICFEQDLWIIFILGVPA